MMRNITRILLSIVLTGILAMLGPAPIAWAYSPPPPSTVPTARATEWHMTYSMADDKRDQLPLDERKRQPAGAALLSTLYPGLGQLYVGDASRAFMIMIPATLILVGGIIGFGLLSERPEQAATLGRLMILAVWIGGHLWNIRDAYNQAEELNRRLEKEDMYSWLNAVEFSWKQDTLIASYRIAL